MPSLLRSGAKTSWTSSHRSSHIFFVYVPLLLSLDNSGIRLVRAYIMNDVILDLIPSPENTQIPSGMPLPNVKQIR